MQCRVVEEAAFETEEMTLKQPFDTITQQDLALEYRVSHLDGAWKECVRQLRQVREENEEKIHKVVTKNAIEWDKEKFDVDGIIVELEELLLEEKVENNKMDHSLQESSKLREIHEAKNHVETEIKIL